MPDSPSPDNPQAGAAPVRLNLARNLAFLALCLAAGGALLGALWRKEPLPAPPAVSTGKQQSDQLNAAVKRLNEDFEKAWAKAGVEPAPQADVLTLTRRLSLGLTGTVPALEEIRALEQQPADQTVQWWLDYLLADRRYSDYVAERLARAYVGVDVGPFLVYRRRRMADWLSDQVHANRPYDALVRDIVNSHGLWTSDPEVNFITATVSQNMDKKGPDEEKLAGKFSRAFLGVRLDCVQCHDDFMGGDWEQKDFHQLAAFFAQAEMSLTGVRDDTKKNYEYRYHGKAADELIPPIVPFQPELLPANGPLREQLAGWLTHPGNRAFARTTVNRVWALLFNRPLIEPIDSIPLTGPYPPGMEVLTDELIASGFDLQRLIRVIAASRVFQRDSRFANPDEHVTDAHEQIYAAFPLTRLRPEQVGGSVIQASTLRAIDAETHVVLRLTRSLQEDGFVKRYGDSGEDEFTPGSGTISQRLLLMNGELVHGRTKENIVMNASTRIASLAPDDATAVETAFKCVLTRSPNSTERTYFINQLEGKQGKPRNQVMEDLYWTLMNATEFSWNH